MNAGLNIVKHITHIIPIAFYKSSLIKELYVLMYLLKLLYNTVIFISFGK